MQERAVPVFFCRMFRLLAVLRRIGFFSHAATCSMFPVI